MHKIVLTYFLFYLSNFFALFFIFSWNYLMKNYWDVRQGILDHCNVERHPVMSFEELLKFFDKNPDPE